MGTLIDQDNRARCGEFVAGVKMALLAKAIAVHADAAASAEAKALAIAIVRNPEPLAAKFAKPLATDPDVSDCDPIVPRNRAGEDTGNGWTYRVPDVLIRKAVDAQWPLLVAAYEPPPKALAPLPSPTPTK